MQIRKCQNEFDELQEPNEKIQSDIVSLVCFDESTKKNFQKVKQKQKE